ncbi:hypothetical protein [uncultured Brevibacillus sp.]|nr:hypothetical protein [uncultured Brevibacillus sp.]
MTIRLRLTTPEDIPFVYELEHAPENSYFSHSVEQGAADTDHIGYGIRG